MSLEQIFNSQRTLSLKCDALPRRLCHATTSITCAFSSQGNDILIPELLVAHHTLFGRLYEGVSASLTCNVATGFHHCMAVSYE